MNFFNEIYNGLVWFFGGTQNLGLALVVVLIAIVARVWAEYSGSRNYEGLLTPYNEATEEQKARLSKRHPTAVAGSVMDVDYVINSEDEPFALFLGEDEITDDPMYLGSKNFGVGLHISGIKEL